MSDLLKQLNKTAKNTKSAPKNERPTMEVPPEALEAFKRLVGANSVLDVCEARKEVEATYVNGIMLDAFSESVFKNGTQPANPRFEVSVNGKPDMSGLFQVQTRFKINIEEGLDEVQNRLILALRLAGLDEEHAKALVENEIDVEPVTTLRPFDELVNGHYQGMGKNRTFVEATEKEKAVGTKLLSFVLGQPAEPFTDDEREVAVVSKENIKPKPGFMQRICNYASSVDEIKAIFMVISPTHFVSHMKFAISDTPEQRQTRLIEEAARILGSGEFTAKEVA